MEKIDLNINMVDFLICGEKLYFFDFELVKQEEGEYTYLIRLKFVNLIS